MIVTAAAIKVVPWPMPGGNSLNKHLEEGIEDISGKAYRAVVLDAINGSPEAANRLIALYDSCPMAKNSDGGGLDLCKNELDRWIAIGLENGSTVAAQIKTIMLLQSKKCADIYRAQYWFDRYKKAGLGNERLWASDLASIRQGKSRCSW